MVSGSLAEDAAGFDEVGDDGGGGGVLAGAAAVEEGIADAVAAEGDGIEDAVDAGEDVGAGDEGGLGADFDGAVLVGADDAEEFDDVAEVFGEADVDAANHFDAADVNLFGIDGETVGEGGEEDGLVGGVPAVDVEGGVGFGVAEVLGFLEGVLIGEAGLGHAFEDVVGGAVDDAGDGLDAVADEAVLDGLDDGDAPGHGGFEVDGGVGFGGEGEEFGAAFGEEGLVAGDDGFFGAEGGGDDVEGGGGAADEFDDEVDGGVLDDGFPVGGEEVGGGVGVAGLGEVADGDAAHLEFHGAVGAGGDQGGVFLQGFPDSGTDGSEAHEADADGFAGHGGGIADGGRRGNTQCRTLNVQFCSSAESVGSGVLPTSGIVAAACPMGGGRVRVSG